MALTAPARDGSRRALQAAVRVCGAIALAAGLDAMARGGRSIPGPTGSLGAEAESELRFFAAHYASYGAALLAAASRVDDGRSAAAAGAPLFAAGLARLAAWRQEGEPNGTQKVLLAFELTIPPALAAWGRAVR